MIRSHRPDHRIRGLIKVAGEHLELASRACVRFTQERHVRQDAAKAALPYEKPRPVTVTLANAGAEPLKVRSELEIGRRLAFVLKLIARGEVKAKMPEPSGRQKGCRNKRTQAREARRFQSSTASRRQRCCNGLKV